MVPDAAPVPLRGLIDTGSGVSILTFSAYNRVAVRTGTLLRPYGIDLYAANGKTIKTFGLAEKVKFQLGGYELETNFVVVDDAMGVEDFLLGRNFLRAYQVLVDLTAMKVIVRAPSEPVWYHAHTQVSNESLNSSVAIAQDVVLQPFERAILRAQLLVDNLEPFMFRTVLINFQTPNRMLKNAIFLEDTVATVGETGFLYVSLGNLNSNVQRIKKGTLLGTAVPVTMVHKAIPQIVPGQSSETQQSNANYVCKVYEQMNLDSSSEYSSSSEFEFLSSTEPSELGLSEREVKRRTDPALMAPIPGPEAQLDEVRGLWGSTASDTLSKLLNEFDDLFMKFKADIGKCKIAKHPVEVEPGAVPHREGARRMSPDKAERANQEVRDLLALGMIQPSLSPWASGIVMVKKKSGELRFCCDFRPLNEVTIKDAYPLPRIDESLSRLGKAKIYTSIDLAWAFWQIPVRKADRQKTAFACELGLFEWRRMPFGMCNASATFQRAIARALQRIVNREGSMVMAYIDDIVIATETIEDHMDRLREVFQCLREAGFKMRVSKCDFMKSEIKYLGRVVSADGIKPDPKAVTKLKEWDIPRTKTELQSFLGFANYYRDFIPWHAKLVAPLQAITGGASSFLWGEEQQRAFNSIKVALMEATALAQPDTEGEFVLDTDASGVAISGILHQWQGPPESRKLRPIVFGSKKLTATQAKYGAPKLEMYAAYYFILKNHSYLCPRKFTLRVDNQALSWLKTYSMDQAIIGRWIMALEKYHFSIEHRPRTQHRNADGLSKRTNDYKKHEKQLKGLPAIADKWDFLSQEEYNKLPLAPWFDVHGRVIPNHPELPAHLQRLGSQSSPETTVAVPTRRSGRSKRNATIRDEAMRAPLPTLPKPELTLPAELYPEYPEDWLELTEEYQRDYLLPTHAANVPSRTTYPLTEKQATSTAPEHVKQAAFVVNGISMEMHEHANTVHGLKDLLLAQNRDVHILAIKKLVMQESIDNDVFPENVRAFAKNYHKQKKNLLLINTNGILCVKYSKSQRALHERPCMIVMPQLYQHEILFKAHDAMGHQGIAKVLARIQERHTWPGIRRTIGQYVSQCITCQQVRDKPGDVRFHLKNIQSGYFNELVQYDHMKICPSDDGNTGILVIIDHFSKLAEAVPCNHDEYDAATTSKLLLQKWFARHGTPTRMQSDNAPNFTAAVSAEFMKAAQVTKVTSTAGHPRTQGLVERQNRTLLTLLRVFCSRRMRDWDQYLDEVMGAYNSTRHATTGFSPYMLTRGMEKAIPLTFLYPEFATQSFESHEAYVEHVLARQQEIHDLVRRNTHQAQQRQKLKYDRAIRAKAYEVGEPVWVFCRYIPQKGSPKLMRAWRGPHKVARVLQEGRVYILDTGQKVHFERLKPHHGGPTEWAAVPAHNGEVAIIMDPDPEQSHEEVRDDASQPSYRAEEPISEASNASLPSRQRHWMDTRLRTHMRAGGSRLHYQQFGYSSTESDDERSDVLLSSVQASPDESVILSSHVDEPAPIPEMPISPLPAMEALFSENEAVPDALDIAPDPTIHVPTKSAATSLTGTSAPLLTNPSLTDMLSNFPIWPLIDDNVLNPTLDDNGAEIPTTNNEKGSIPPATVPTNNNAATTTKLSNAPRGRGPRGRPPGRARPRASLPRGHQRRGAIRGARKRGRPRGRPPRITHARPNTPTRVRSTPSMDTDSSAPSAAVTSDQAAPPESTNARYGLRHNRIPRYRCGTCGLRDCECNYMVHAGFPIKPQGVLLAREQEKSLPSGTVDRLVIRAEKTYTGLQRSDTPYPVDYILSKMKDSTIAKAPCPRFKEWTYDLVGLEFTLPITVPPLPTNIAFGPFNYEREPIQMIRCIPADLLYDKYNVTAKPGDVYQPTSNWWLLVTAKQTSDLVHPTNLNTCLESLRTMASPDRITCFHTIDLYRGKIKFEWWLELIIAVLSNFSRIRFLDEWTHSFPSPVSLQSALHALDTWSRANIDNQSLPRSVWQDLGAIKGLLPNTCNDALSKDPGRELVYHGAVRPQLVDYVQYANTDFLQTPHHIVLCCPANLETSSAALRYVIREHGADAIFQLRPEVGNIVTLPTSLIDGHPQTIHLLITRATPRCPMLADILFGCLDHLKTLLERLEAIEVHFAIIDPERPIRNLFDFYTCLMDVFADTPLTVVLHDRVYVSIASVASFP